jgi:hypothetical protein
LGVSSNSRSLKGGLGRALAAFVIAQGGIVIVVLASPAPLLSFIGLSSAVGAADQAFRHAAGALVDVIVDIALDRVLAVEILGRGAALGLADAGVALESSVKGLGPLSCLLELMIVSPSALQRLAGGAGARLILLERSRLAPQLAGETNRRAA